MDGFGSFIGTWFNLLAEDFILIQQCYFADEVLSHKFSSGTDAIYFLKKDLFSTLHDNATDRHAWTSHRILFWN